MDSELEKTLVQDTASSSSTQESKPQLCLSSLEVSPTGELNLSNGRLKQISKQQWDEKAHLFVHLDLRENEITLLEELHVFALEQLRTLDLRKNRVEYLPEDIRKLRGLRALRLDENLLSYLPKSLWTLTDLEALTLSRNSLFSLPVDIGSLRHLKSLVLSDNRLLSLPQELGQLANLLALSLHGNEFSALPTSLHSLTQLKEISLEWFRYTCPPLPRVIRGNIGERMIQSLCELCLQLSKQSLQSCPLIMFLLHFSEEEAQPVMPKSKKSMLHLAALEGDNGVIKGLVESGLSVNVGDAEGYSPFCLALREGKINSAKLLLEKGTDIRIGGGTYGTPLHLAVLRQEPWLVRDILKRGAMVNGKDREGNTALHVSLSCFDSPRKAVLIADMLVHAGASVNLENSDRQTALDLAVKLNQIDAVRWVLMTNKRLTRQRKEIFNLNHKGRGGITAMHVAAHTGHYEIMRLLAEVGQAKVCVRTNDGLTPRLSAKKELAIVKYLIATEKEELRDAQRKIQRVQVLTEEPSTRLPCSADVLNTAMSFSERYCALYGLFVLQKTDELREAANALGPDSLLLPDAIYLLGQLDDMQALPLVEKAANDPLASSILREEADNSLERLRTASQPVLPVKSQMGPKLQRSEQVLRSSQSVRAFPIPL